MTEYAVNLGVPRDHILTTGKVMNTDAEARAVAELLADQENSHGAPTVLLVTSAFHMRRAQLLFTRAGVETSPFPVDFRADEGRVLTILDFLPVTHPAAAGCALARNSQGSGVSR